MSQLIRATRNGDLDKVKLLVKNGININYQPYNTDGSALMRAVAGNQHPEIAKFVIKAGADLNLQDEVGDTALMYASNAGSTEMVKILLKAGADPNIPDKDGNTPLHLMKDLPWPRDWSRARLFDLLIDCLLSNHYV